MSFLGGLGSVAGGASQSLSPYLEQYLGQMRQNNEDTAAGLGIYAAMGVTPPQQSPSTPSAPTPQMGQVAPPQQIPMPSPAPPAAPTGIARSPMTQPSAAPMAPSPQASAMPAPSQFTPQAGPQAAPQVSPIAPRPVPSAPGPSPMMAPGAAPLAQAKPPVMSPGPSSLAAVPPGAQGQGQPAPSQGQPPVLTAQQEYSQPNQQQRQGRDLSQFDGMFDYTTLMSNILRTPGMTPQKAGMISRQPAFERMLTQQGLNQYRALNLQLGAGRLGVSEDRLSLDAKKMAEQQDRLREQKSASLQTQALTRQAGVLKTQYSQQMQQIMFGPSVDANNKPIDKQAAVKKLNDDFETANKKIADQQDKINKVFEGGDSSGGEQSSEGGGANPLEEAKAAIAAGAPRDAVIKRFKEINPGIDASGL